MRVDPAVLRRIRPGPVLGLLGLALAVPALIWPTWRLVVSDPGRGEVLQRQLLWSWGQSSTTNSNGFELTVPHLPGIAFYILALLGGFAGLVSWLLVRGARGAAICLVGLSIAATRVVAAALERLGLAARLDSYAKTGLDVRSYVQQAAIAEDVAAVLLVTALALALVSAWRSLGTSPGFPTSPLAAGPPEADAVSDTATATATAAAATATTTAAATADPDTATHGQGPRVGPARLVPADEQRQLGGDEVSFVDTPPAADHRFEPPT